MGTQDLLVRDFGDPNQKKAESWYEYIARTKYEGSIYKALKWANSTFKLNLGLYSFDNDFKFGSNNKIVKGIDYSLPKKATIIKIKKRNWYKKDIDYWQQYGITLNRVKSKYISPISHFWINDTIINLSGKLAYAYPLGIHDNIFRYKIYQPFDEKFKWISNTHKNIIQNYNFIPDAGELLIIQSSFKDVLCMEELGYYSIAPNSENIFINKDIFLKLQKNWNKIIFFANNDWNKLNNPGLAYAKQHQDKYNIDIIHTPDGWSDISDYIKDNGLLEASNLIKKLINDIYPG